ncbi:FAD-dependent oxidoreductase [Streptomyces violaceus]|uniref:FAD-dependent oxidoreductase n=1 Tax=Streptomyces violaceus TaxID=1936 RepID=UPI002E29E7FE|nr:FAD-dependent oxidoreductase [Streptomyces violaceus]
MRTREERRRPRVAVVGPFSGPRAAWGELLSGAVDSVRRAPVDWEFFDDRGDAEQGGARACEVVADGGFAAVVGHFNSLGARDALPVYREHRLPVLLPLATAPGLLDGSDGLALRLCSDDAGQAAAVVAACREQGYECLDVVHDGTGYGLRLAGLLREAAEPELSVGVHSEWRTTRGAAIALCGVHHGAAALLRSRAPVDPGQWVVATDDCDIPEFAELAGAAAEGVRVARLTGGPAARVVAACAALAGALGKHPERRGERLVETVRGELACALDARGEPVNGSPGAGWEVLPVAAPPTPRDSFDVAVVGAGVVGRATAAEVAERGRSVALLDGAGDAASTVSGALVRAYEADIAERGRAIRSFQLLWGREERAAAHGFRRTGSLVLFGPGGRAAADEGVADLVAGGLAAEVLDIDDVTRRWPLIEGEGLEGAVWEPDGGYAVAAVALAAMTDRARRAGAHIVPGPAARTLADDAGSGVVVDGRLHAAAAVLAAGCGTPELLGEHWPAGHTARTKRIQYAVFERPAGTGSAPLPALVDLTTGMWARPDGLDAVLAGFPVEEWDVPPTTDSSLTATQIGLLRERVGPRLPFLTAARALTSVRGRDLYVSPAALLGPVPGLPRTVVAAGWSGSGFKSAPAAAEAAAELAARARPAGGPPARAWTDATIGGRPDAAAMAQADTVSDGRGGSATGTEDPETLPAG